MNRKERCLCVFQSSHKNISGIDHGQVLNRNASNDFVHKSDAVTDWQCILCAFVDVSLMIPVGTNDTCVLFCDSNSYPCFSFVSYREWVNKVERIRSRNTEAQECWKEGGEERSERKNSWADSGEPRAPSPGSVTQYNKTGPPQDYQVKHTASIYSSFSALFLCGLYFAYTIIQLHYTMAHLLIENSRLQLPS